MLLQDLAPCLCYSGLGLTTLQHCGGIYDQLFLKCVSLWVMRKYTFEVKKQKWFVCLLSTRPSFTELVWRRFYEPRKNPFNLGVYTYIPLHSDLGPRGCSPAWGLDARRRSAREQRAHESLRFSTVGSFPSAHERLQYKLYDALAM